MSYRDELEATRARADAAEEEREELAAQALAAEERAGELEQKLRVAQEEAQRLRMRGGTAAPKDAVEEQLSMLALETSLEHKAEKHKRERRFAIVFLVIFFVGSFLFVTRLYDPLFEFLLDDIWGR